MPQSLEHWNIVISSQQLRYLHCEDKSNGLSPDYNRSDIAHYNDVIMGTMASQIISLNIVYSTVYSGTDERKPQSSASLAFLRGIHRSPVSSPHKGPVTWKMFPFDDVIMWSSLNTVLSWRLGRIYKTPSIHDIRYLNSGKNQLMSTYVFYYYNYLTFV